MKSRYLGVDNADVTQSLGNVRILKIPYDGTTCYQPGTRNGPSAILDASLQLELFDEDLAWDASQHLNFFVEDEIPVNCRGPEDMMSAIYQSACDLVQPDNFVMSFGGEHSISAPLISAHLRKHSNLHVVQIDAHADLRETWDGTPHSHACVMRRVADLGVPIVQIGIRNISEEGHRFLNSQAGKSITTFQASSLRKSNDFEELLNHLRNEITGPVYLTIDVDGLDPSIVPAVGTPEPGGLGWYEMVEIIKTISTAHQVVGADIVELSPIPGLTYADFAVAKLSYKIISHVFCSQ